MTFSIKIKSNKRLAEEFMAMCQDHPRPVYFPYNIVKPIKFFAMNREGELGYYAFISCSTLPRRFSIGFWGRTRIEINFWPLFTVLIKI